ncbi:hypothetical protein CDO52_25675 [Nocardiopsis gilva YIM 90087]|uniref:PIN domain-containing protein n=1 Tax=Nocardiopsis gilva YIM 90087 TaxID=1235441 RepID=A0A223SCE5_9ACTN|nr:hypothetical protein [Nocardiopsis gilva]ASU85743.1 hypothetical protein CDO52_25675 [Nocardiopsis gilva YIM 90087]
MKQRSSKTKPLQIYVLDSEALSQAVRGDRRMLTRFKLAAQREVELVTSPMTLIEACDGKTTEGRWNWVLSRVRVVAIGKEEARAAHRLLADAQLHGHEHAIDAVLAVIARQLKGEVTILTSDVGDLEKLVPDTTLVRNV